jgi:hypothetical protein
MSTRLTREVRDLIGAVDPVPAEPLVSDVARRADMRWVMATGPARQARRRRPMLVGAVVATSLALVAVVAYEVVPRPEPAFAATPTPLVFAGGGGSAAALLTGIADRAATARAPAAAGNHEHLVTLSWSLWSQIDGERVRSAVVPSRTESWRGADDSGRVSVTYEKPQFPNGSDRWSWRLNGAPGGSADPRTENYPAGGFPAMWPGNPPATGLADWLTIGHPAANGPAETLVAVTDLARERVLTPQLRASLLRRVASLPGLAADGAVTDRAGRQGQAFSLVSDHSGLPTRYTLIVDPATGALLDYESMLTTTAGKLDVKIPAVIGYETYMTGDFTAAPK